jgi:uncharacterized coiled-coil protein SlyX
MTALKRFWLGIKQWFSPKPSDNERLRDELIAEYKQHIADLKARVAEKDQTIAEYKYLIGEKNSLIKELRNQLQFVPRMHGDKPATSLHEFSSEDIVDQPMFGFEGDTKQIADFEKRHERFEEEFREELNSLYEEQQEWAEEHQQ